MRRHCEKAMNGNCMLRPILQTHFEVWGLAFSFNFILYRDRVKTVNIPVHKRNATGRIVVEWEVQHTST